jgi:transposase
MMASMGRKKPRPRRSFTPEFKADIVERCRVGDRTVGQVARDFDLTETAVREWVKQAERDEGSRVDGGVTSSEREELAQLRRDNRRLREDVEILERATLSSRRLSSQRRPGECLPVHRGGKAAQHYQPGQRRERRAGL